MVNKIGKKIRSLRKAYEMTLSELGEASGISASFASQIERGLTSVSLESLENIANSLGVSVDYLFYESGDHVSSLTHSSQYICPSDKSYYYKKLSNSVGGKKVRVIQMTCLPCSKDISFVNSRTGFIYIISGILTIELDGEIDKMYHGDSLYFDENIDYKFSNDSEGLINMLYITYLDE